MTAPSSFFRPGSRSRIAFDDPETPPAEGGTTTVVAKTTGGSGIPDKAHLLDPEGFSSFRGLVEREGGIGRTGEVLYRENRDYRQKNTALAEENQRLKAAGATGGASDQDLELLKTYQELGEPDKLREKIQNGEEATKKLVKRERVDTARKAVKAVGYDPDRTLEVWDPSGDQIEWEDQGEGEDKKKVPVRVDGDKKTPLADFLAERFPTTHESLRVQKAKQETKGTRTVSQSAAATETSDGASLKDMARKQMAKRYSAPKKK